MKHDPTKLPMTNEEIRREYLEAKDRKAQIRILTDENLCSVSRIKDILKSEGVWEPRKYERKTAPCFEDDPLFDVIDACDDNTYYPYKEGEGGNTDAILRLKEEPQTGADETIEDAATLDAAKAEQLERLGEEFKKFMDTRLNTTVCTLELNENTALAVAAMVTYCLKRCDAKIERINASLEEITKRKRDQELVRDTLLSIKERLPKFEKFNFEKSNLFDEEGK